MVGRSKRRNVSFILVIRLKDKQIQEIARGPSPRGLSRKKLTEADMAFLALFEELRKKYSFEAYDVKAVFTKDVNSLKRVLPELKGWDRKIIQIRSRKS